MGCSISNSIQKQNYVNDLRIIGHIDSEYKFERIEKQIKLSSTFYYDERVRNNIINELKEYEIFSPNIKFNFSTFDFTLFDITYKLVFEKETQVKIKNSHVYFTVYFEKLNLKNIHIRLCIKLKCDYYIVNNIKTYTFKMWFENSCQTYKYKMILT